MIWFFVCVLVMFVMWGIVLDIGFCGLIVCLLFFGLGWGLRLVIRVFRLMMFFMMMIMVVVVSLIYSFF